MTNYLFRLLPPRPTFMMDMTPEEQEVMQAHVAYWADLMQKGLVVAYGPVAAVEGAFGIAILQLPEDESPEPLVANDPAILSGKGFSSKIDLMPMLVSR
ncbi:YCII-related domain-containing protein [Roseimicrobium gellanilyticum]|uniref:YCII-related domain-containing protein n=1 Tax=Roseimicrobium gellanilyticum TaxID=748857 RepID=A0A366HNP9_9BACT|nr:YciI family protein [Roseimicrobium gellanilyticum]RBP45117.1 YCII-related domain-containing protein [Roseimicrobium gellanilyticum]